MTTANPGAYRLLGWISVRAYYDIAVLKFFYKTLLMESSCIFKRVVLYRVIDVMESNSNKDGPTSYFLALCHKYKLLDCIKELIRTGHSVSLNEFSKLCKSSVLQFEHFIYSVEMGMCEKLSNMVNIKPGVHQWWKVAKSYPEALRACRFMAKCLVGEEPLLWNTGRYVQPRSMQNRMCTVCDSGGFETVRHFLFECDKLLKSRCSFINTLHMVCIDADYIINCRDHRAVISAELNVGSNYKYKFKLLAESIYSMEKVLSQVECYFRHLRYSGATCNYFVYITITSYFIHKM